MKLNKSFLIIFVLILAVFLPSCKDSGGETKPVDSGTVEIPSMPETSTAVQPQADVTSDMTVTNKPAESVPVHGTTPSRYPDATPPTTSNYNEFTANSENAPDVENNITVKTEQAFYTVSETVIKLEVTNLTGWLMIFADEYILEKSSDSGWQKVPLKEGVFNKAPMYDLGTGKTGIATIDLSFVNVPLDKGRYRVSIMCACNGHAAGNFYKSAEFTLK